VSSRRRYKLTPPVVKKICTAIRVGSGLELACFNAARETDLDGLTARALYKAMTPDPLCECGASTCRKCVRALKLRDQIDEARAFADDYAQKRLYDMVRAGNVPALKFWLCNRRPAEWKGDMAAAIGAGDSLIDGITVSLIRGVNKHGEPQGVEGNGNGAAAGNGSNGSNGGGTIVDHPPQPKN